MPAVLSSYCRAAAAVVVATSTIVVVAATGVRLDSVDTDELLDSRLDTVTLLVAANVVSTVDSMTSALDEDSTGEVVISATVATVVPSTVAAVPGSALVVSARMQSDLRADEALDTRPIEFKNNRPFRRTV